jgi:hypothetical protein
MKVCSEHTAFGRGNGRQIVAHRAQQLAVLDEPTNNQDLIDVQFWNEW